MSSMIPGAVNNDTSATEIAAVAYEQRLESVETRLEIQACELQELRRLVTTSCSEIPRAAVDGPPATPHPIGNVQLDDAPIEMMEPVADKSQKFQPNELSQSDEYTLGESAWEAVLIAWTAPVGFGGSIMICFMLIVNVATQILFCLVAYMSFAVPDGKFFDGVEKDARQWRLTDAHSADRMDKASWVSLAARVCNLDSTLIYSSSQASLLEEGRTYTESNQGLMLTMVVLLLWSLTIGVELMNCADFLNAVTFLPKARLTDLTQTDGSFAFESISCLRRVVVLCVQTLRVGVAVFIWIFGGLWLSKTTSLPDLVLNATALAFVLDLDELLYNTMMPLVAKSVVETIEPLKKRQSAHIHGLNWQPPCFICICTLYIALCMTIAFRNNNLMRAVDSIMCGNNPNFVVAPHAALGYAVVGQTRNTSGAWVPMYDGLSDLDSKMNMDSLLKLVVANFTVDPHFDTDMELTAFAKKFSFDLPHSEAVVKASPTEFRTELSLQPEEKFFHVKCEDALNTLSGSAFPGYLNALRYATHIKDAANCSSVTHLCKEQSAAGKLVRSYCSHSCNCNSHFGFLVDYSGCSATCTAYMTNELSNTEVILTEGVRLADCFDRPAVLFDSEEAMYYISQVVGVFQIQDFPYDKFRTYGCATLSLEYASQIFDPIYGPEGAKWLPDLLCGRAIGMEFALPDLEYMTLRWLCPVTCGCTISMTDQCPPSCGRGPGSEGMDLCVAGMCPGAAVNSSETVVIRAGEGTRTESCDNLETNMKSGTFLQKDCAEIRAQLTLRCCMS